MKQLTLIKIKLLKVLLFKNFNLPIILNIFLFLLLILFKQNIKDLIALNLLINNKLDDQHVNPVDPENSVILSKKNHF